METDYTLELENGITNIIPHDLLYTSNTLHKQKLYNNTTHLKALTITPRGLALFYRASTITPTEFDYFFNTLSHKDRRTLIKTAGKNHLNNPALTALLVQSYFPQEIQNLIANYCNDIKQNIDYHIRASEIDASNLADNISLDVASLFSRGIKHLYHTHGNPCCVPQHFNTKANLCSSTHITYEPISTTDISLSYCGETDTITVPAGTCYLTMLRFLQKDSNIEHIVTLDTKDNSKGLLLWKKERDKHYVAQKIPCDTALLQAIANNDGTHILLNTVFSHSLCTISPSCTPDLCSVNPTLYARPMATYGKIALSNNGTIFVECVLAGEEHSTTTFFFSNTSHGTPYRAIKYDGVCKDLAFSHNDAHLITLMHNDNTSIVCIYNMIDKDTITLLHEFTCRDTFKATKIYSSPYDDHWIIADKNGDLLSIIKDNDTYPARYHIRYTYHHESDAEVRQALVFSPDKHFAYVYTNYYNYALQATHTLRAQMPLLSLLDLRTQSYINATIICCKPSSFQPRIVFHKDSSCLWINFRAHSSAWQRCTLYSKQTVHFLRWFNAHYDNIKKDTAHNAKKPTLFQLYALNRLLIAYNNQETLIPTCDVTSVAHCFDHEHSDIRTCVNKYLYNQDTQENQKSIIQQIRSFF
jgi:hypothetical protein